MYQFINKLLILLLLFPSFDSSIFRRKRDSYQGDQSGGLRSAINVLNEMMLKVAQTYFTFKNEANNRLHESLENFEEQVIDSFSYFQVCYPGGGRKKREVTGFEEALEMAAKTNNVDAFITVSEDKYISQLLCLKLQVFIKSLEENRDTAISWADRNLNISYPFNNEKLVMILHKIVYKNKKEKDDKKWTDILGELANAAKASLPHTVYIKKKENGNKTWTDILSEVVDAKTYLSAPTFILDIPKVGYLKKK